MGLFTRKNPCAICGGKVSGLFPKKVQRQLVCKECYGTVYLPDEFEDNMTLEQFKEYRAFREENSKLRQQFQITRQVKLTAFGNSFAFDEENRLFCPDGDLEATIFEADCVRSFAIYEDNFPLFEGDAKGLTCHESSVPDRVMAMAPMVEHMARVQEMRRRAERSQDNNRQPQNNRNNGRPQPQNNRMEQVQSLPEPFQQFRLEIRCDHPYWPVIRFSRSGPTFNDANPSVRDYLRDYEKRTEALEQLAQALMDLAFPGAAEQSAAPDAPQAPVEAAPAPSAAPATDIFTELERYKELMDKGVITEEEFTAKKRQMLGL